MKPTGWNQFLLDITHDYNLRGKLKEVFLARFAYEHWRKSDLEVWEIAEAASHETYKKQMTQIYGVFANDKPEGCPELDASSRGPGKFQLLRDWFKEVKYPQWQSEQFAGGVNSLTPALTVGRGNPLGDNVIYVLRLPTEQQCLEELNRGGALLRIKAPEKMGKTSLLQFLLGEVEATGDRHVYLNLQTAESAMFSNLDKFLRWFCANLSRELGIKPNLDDYWDEELFGSLVSCKTYVQDYLLGQTDRALVLAIDNLDRLFEFPVIAQDFLPMLRYWHEESNNLAQWQKLRLIIANSTEAYVKLDANQSPFNVGRQWKLTGFTKEQILQLKTAYGFDENQIEEENLLNLGELVGGHPYLIRLALDAVQKTSVDLPIILANAVTQSGIYSNHLRRLWGLLTGTPDLAASMKQVVNSDSPVQLDPPIAYRLESMGLVTLSGDRCRASCPLYQRYFHEQL
ncbi:AAA-like domain-containing protein [Synechocystis salina LEGE 06099]|uniref:AAA-like domain-containing protein n=1 Tax=Synechocystis salina TaxID=945780 RepID=UPI0018819C2C|nr:AAA-like domain-containing protein [Synechocystis salina]MBE9202191.1 AAA-like domain-containing protein [Synechocystis salina LEGE 06099]